MYNGPKVPLELSADELGDVTGGSLPPEDCFVECSLIFSIPNPFCGSAQGEFCRQSCEYRGTLQCVNCYHSSSISDTAIYAKFKAYEKEWRELNQRQ